MRWWTFYTIFLKTSGVNFIFSKELIDHSPAYNPGKQLRLYTLLDDQNQLIGQFLYYPQRSIISLGGKEISIVAVSKLLKKTKYTLLDKNDNRQIGEYEILGGFGINPFWQDVPSSPTGTIQIDNTLFNFRRIQPDVPYSSLKKETWGYFKFRLYAIRGQEFYEYAVKMDVPAWSISGDTRYRPFTGTIESNAGNALAMLAGLYLMEVEFDYEDTKNDG